MIALLLFRCPASLVNCTQQWLRFDAVVCPLPPSASTTFASLPPSPKGVEEARVLYKYNNINILLHLQRYDIEYRCNMDDLTPLLHTIAASTDPGEPVYLTPLLVLKVDMREKNQIPQTLHFYTFYRFVQ